MGHLQNFVVTFICNHLSIFQNPGLEIRVARNSLILPMPFLISYSVFRIQALRVSTDRPKTHNGGPCAAQDTVNLHDQVFKFGAKPLHQLDPISISSWYGLD